MILVVVIIAIVVAVFLTRVYQKNTNEICKSKKKLYGKTTLITGGTTGMGLEIATDFAHRGAKVIIACPFQEEGVNARKLIIENTGNDKVVFKYLDLSSLKSVRVFAEGILKTEKELHILVNNAGVGIPDDTTTADGLSFIMQVNYVGHFLLTMLLLPLLRKTGEPNEPSRIVNTSSILHMFGRGDFVSRERKNFWMKILTYGNSKFCFIPFSRELTKRLKESGANVVVNSVDPGAVGTRIFYSAGVLIGAVLTFLCGNIFKTPWEGAQTAIHVALDAKAGEMSGEFFKNCKLSRAIYPAYNNKVIAKVWEKSIKAVNLTNEECDELSKINIHITK